MLHIKKKNKQTNKKFKSTEGLSEKQGPAICLS